ncbi:MAG: hypothetical protein ACPGWR_22605 [Ardenticatenaceae bacterium]
MAKTIFFTDEDVAKYATLSDVLQFKDLDIVKEAYDDITNIILFYEKRSLNVGVCENVVI